MFAGVVTGIEQTMFGQPLYEGAESKAAHLFYFTIKDPRSSMAISASRNLS